MKKAAKKILLLLLLLGIVSFVQYAVIQLAWSVNTSFQSSKRHQDNPSSRVTNVLFLKTHKTASSTLTSILNRFADLNDLDIALPSGELQHRFNWPAPFKVESVDETRLKKKRANVLANHAVFSSKKEFDKILYPGAKYVTILRDPVYRFESLLFYEDFDKLLPNTTRNLVLDYVEIAKYDRLIYNISVRQSEVYSKLFKNGMTFDLTSVDSKKADANALKLIKQVEETFDFVMLAEYFDHGLVLLRKLFNWKFLDFVYKKKNVRRSKHKELLTDKVKSGIAEINKADVLLYEHFKKLFERKVEAYGEDFVRHLQIFRVMNREINLSCKKGNHSSFSMEDVRYTLDELELSRSDLELVGNINTISDCFCVKLHRGEVTYVNYFKDKFQPYYYLQRSDDGKKQEC